MKPEGKKRARPAKAAAKKPVAKKAAAKVAVKKAPTRRPAKARRSYEPSDDEIRIRAYFIAEQRSRLLLAGDPSQDWLDARQQLIEESGKRGA